MQMIVETVLFSRRTRPVHAGVY